MKVYEELLEENLEEDEIYDKLWGSCTSLYDRLWKPPQHIGRSHRRQTEAMMIGP